MGRGAGVHASGAGAEAVLTFTGSAVAVVGDIGQDGGRADVYLDGKRVRPIDAYVGERTHDNDLWHTYGLSQRQHTLKIVTRDDADSQSKGKRIAILGAIVYRGEVSPDGSEPCHSGASPGASSSRRPRDQPQRWLRSRTPR